MDDEYSDELRDLKDRIRQLRDAARPDIETVAEIMARSLIDEGVRLLRREDDMWIWVDDEVAALPKYYILTRSVDPETEGYPLVTLRSCYSLELDSWMTNSSLISGKDVASIGISLAMLFAVHAAAFAGMRFASKAALATGGSPIGAIMASKQLQELEPENYGGIRLDGPPGKGELN